MTITSAILAQLPLADINAVVFYKRDEITTDLICCDIDVNGRISTFHEEANGWVDLITHLSALPGFAPIGMPLSSARLLQQARLLLSTDANQ